MFRIAGCAYHSRIERQDVHWSHRNSVTSSSRILTRTLRHFRDVIRHFIGRGKDVQVHHSCKISFSHQRRSSGEFGTIMEPKEGLRARRLSICRGKLKLKSGRADPSVNKITRSQDWPSRIRGGRVRTKKSPSDTVEKVRICHINERDKMQNFMSSEDQIAEAVENSPKIVIRNV